jgi:lysophospholipid acyltransferase (LPLAT)-like uncharacterized protein
VDGLARAWGRAVARYYRACVPAERIVWEGRRPPGSTIWLGWHQGNLLALTCYPRMPWARACHGIVPDGIVGVVARAWVEAAGIRVSPLPPPGATSTPPALAELAEALAAGHDVVIAGDGPHGPPGRVRAGALWLARQSGCPLVPVGFAAAPALHVPRWDRLLVPLPGARVAIRLGEPIHVAADERLTRPLRLTAARALDDATRQAQVLLHDRRAPDQRPRDAAGADDMTPPRRLA